MTPELAEYIEAGKALDADERLEAALQLLLTIDHDLDADQNAIDDAWGETVDERVREIVHGRAQLVDGREAHARIRAEITARHQ